jgi:hypothetical protein
MSLRDRSGLGRAAVALSRRRPALWHCTFMGAWPQIQAYGLLSVARLVELAKSPVVQRQQLMLMPRADVWRVQLPNGGQALLRDQHPLHSRRLHRYLDEMSQEQWLQLLNARVFLFTQELHVQRLIKAYSDQGQDVLKLKTASLLAAHEDQVEVTTRNSGALPRTSQPSRGPNTFVLLAEFPPDRVAAIQEVTILGGVERIEPFVTNVIRYHPDGSKRRIWP